MWQQFELASELGSDLQDTVDWRKKLISMLGKLNWFYLTGLITLVLLMWKSSGVLRYWGWPFLLNWIGAGTLSLAKTTSKKIAALIRSMKFLSPEVALYLYKSTIHPCMKYCCHVRAGAPSCYLELWDKLQKRICRTVGPSLATLATSIFLIGIHSMQGTTTTRHGVTSKRSAKRLKHTWNLFRKNLHTVNRCLLILDLKPNRS